MNRLSNLKLKTKIIINATALVISTSFLAFVSIIGIYMLQSAAKESEEYYAPIIAQAILINNNFSDASDLFNEAMNNPVEEKVKEYELQLNVLTEHFNNLKILVSDDVRAEMIALTLVDFEAQLQTFNSASISLVRQQAQLNKVQLQLNTSLNSFVTASTNFLNSIYNNILTSQNAELERRIKRVQDMVGVIDGMKNTITEVNRSIYISDDTNKEQIIKNLTAIRNTVDRLHNGTKVAATKELAKKALDETNRMNKLIGEIYNEISLMNKAKKEEAAASISIADYISSINSMASDLMVNASKSIVNTSNQIFVLIFISMVVGSFVALAIVLFMIKFFELLYLDTTTISL